MTFSNDDETPSDPWAVFARHVALALIVAVTLVLIVGKLIGNENEFEIVLNPQTGAKITAAPGREFDAMLDEALTRDPGKVHDILKRRDFYQLHSRDLAIALRETEPADLDPGMLARYRKIFWDLEGPFALPGTLYEMDARLLTALEDLEDGVLRRGLQSALMAEIWQQSIVQQGIFRPRLINAGITLLAGPEVTPEDEYPVFYTCPGSPLDNRLITIAPEPGTARAVSTAGLEPLTGFVEADALKGHAMGCGPGRGTDFAGLLAGDELKLGLTYESYEKLFEVEMGSGGPEDRMPAKVQVGALQRPG